MTATHLFWLAMAGALGTLARFATATTVQRWLGDDFAWGTLVVNVVGCLLFGVVWSLAEDLHWIGRELRTIILTGFMGAFTTFSTYAFETTLMARESQPLLALLNIAGQNLLGLAAVFLGAAVVRLLG